MSKFLNWPVIITALVVVVLYNFARKWIPQLP